MGIIKTLNNYYKENKITLEEHFAAVRTILANERTFLAYLQTSMTLIIAGFTLIKIFSDSWMRYFAFSLIFIGCIVILFGYFSFNRMQKFIIKWEKESQSYKISESPIVEKKDFIEIIEK